MISRGSPGFNPSSLGTVPKGSSPLLGSIHNENCDLGSSRRYSQHLGSSLPLSEKAWFKLASQNGADVTVVKRPTYKQ